MRGDALGADGNTFIRTPNLDALAARGTRFRHAYSAVPSCLPARAVLWTGQNQWHAGLLGMGDGQGNIPDDYPHTLAGELTKAGYRTHLVGKGHFYPQRTSMGFESAELDESGRMPDSDHRRWFASQAPPGVTPDDHGVDWNSWHARPWHTEERLHPSAWTMTRALEFLGRRDPDRPFFLNISFARPHSPYVPPRDYFALYDRPGATPPAAVGDWAHVHDAPPHEARDPNAWRGRMSDAEIHRARAGYYGEISFIDTQIGRLLCWMQNRMDRAAIDNTWIVFTSDHGDMQGDHHLWRKSHAYEGSARVPLLVVPPPGLGPLGDAASGVHGFTRSMASCVPSVRPVAGEVVELRDIMPTVLDAADLSSPPTVDGRSLLPLMRGEVPDWRTHIHGEHCTASGPVQEMQYVTNGLRKLIWLPRTGQEQFFDLESDPRELQDLIGAPDRAEEISLWKGRLVAELESRNCGWVKDGGLCCPDDRHLISPYRDVRWMGG